MIEERLDDYIAYPHKVLDTLHESDQINSFLKLILPKNNNSLFQALFYRIRLRHEATKYDEVFKFLLKLCHAHIINSKLNLKDPVYKINKGISQYPDTTWIVVADPQIWMSLADVDRVALVKYYKSNKCPRIVSFCAHKLLKEGINKPQNMSDVFYDKIRVMSIHIAQPLDLD